MLTYKSINVYLPKERKEDAMESVAKEKMENVERAGEETKKKGFGTKFFNFLAYGGFLVILIGGFALYLFIWWLFK